MTFVYKRCAVVYCSIACKGIKERENTTVWCILFLKEYKNDYELMIYGKIEYEYYGCFLNNILRVQQSQIRQK